MLLLILVDCSMMEREGGLTATVVERLRELRKEQGMSAQQLAERCAAAGVPTLTRGTIAKIESRVRGFITLDEMAALAAALGVSPHELLEPDRSQQAPTEGALPSRRPADGEPVPPTTAPTIRRTITSSEPDQGFWVELSNEDRAALINRGFWGEFAPGAVVQSEGEMPDHVLVIWSGLVKVVTGDHAGRPVLLALRGPGDIVGELASIDGSPRSASVVAINRLKALLVHVDHFRGFLSESPRASQVLQRVVAGRLRDSEEHRRNASTATGQRLARLLLELARSYGRSTSDGIVVSVHLSQADLGGFVGSSPRAVARQIERWRDQGVVATGRRQLIIQQSDVLRSIAES